MGLRRDDPHPGLGPPEPTNVRRARAGVAAHRLSMVLGRLSGTKEVCAAVLSHAVRAVPSRFGSFAVPADAGRLSIVATHGYPSASVADVRISPGEGILGSVFANRQTLRVADMHGFAPDHAGRSRYRTGAFLAVPVIAGGETLGVLSLSDRLDDRPYTRDDQQTIHALLAPAALALAREAAREEARRFLHASTIDPVSGLFNRRYFHVRLAEELERADRHGIPVALLMMDVDDFKGINDRFGHTAGDAVIRDVSEILRHSVRVFDVCTRYGGEEFAIVMPGTGAGHAAGIAERIRQRMEGYRPQQPHLADIRVTASIGLAVSTGSSAHDLIDRADRALYTAKRAGKNRLVQAPAPPAGE